MPRPASHEYQSFMQKYIDLVPEEDILPLLRDQAVEFRSLIESISDVRGASIDPPYAWSIKQVVGHVTDAEQIFGYRALRFARRDSTFLPSFDENHFVDFGGFDRSSMHELAHRFHCVRMSNLALFDSLVDEAWSFIGNAGSGEISVRALAFAIAGHVRHHHTIILERLNKS